MISGFPDIVMMLSRTKADMSGTHSPVQRATRDYFQNILFTAEIKIQFWTIKLNINKLNQAVWLHPATGHSGVHKTLLVQVTPALWSLFFKRKTEFANAGMYECATSPGAT